MLRGGAKDIEEYTTEEDDASAATDEGSARSGRTKRAGSKPSAAGTKRKQVEAATPKRRGVKKRQRGATPGTEVESASDDAAGKIGGQGNGGATVEKGMKSAELPCEKALI